MDGVIISKSHFALNQTYGVTKEGRMFLSGKEYLSASLYIYIYNSQKPDRRAKPNMNRERKNKNKT